MSIMKKKVKMKVMFGVWKSKVFVSIFGLSLP
jgi:hypothetical protein